MKRPDLDLMLEAGIKTARFSAHVAGMDEKGYIALEQVQSPIGESDHIFVHREFFDQPPAPRSDIDFVADIYEYQQQGGRRGTGITNLRIVKVRV